MKRRRTSRILSGALALSLLVLPAQALSPDSARQLLSEYYIDPIPQDVLEQSSIAAMLEKLGDPYTQYFEPQQYQDFLASMEDTNIVGIGIVSLMGMDGLTITGVLAGSPAEQSGLMVGDIITMVDDQSAVGVDSTLVSSWIRGEEGTSIQLTYQRDGQSHHTTLTRAAITVPSTTYQLLDKHIGYLECTTFGPDTLEHVQDAVTSNSAADRWIVDLRGNGGGLTQAAVESIGVFTGSGKMGYLRDGAGQYSVFAQSDDALTNSPVIVLSDGYTASASELFSSCIRDLNAGIVVGGRSYGKGVAQNLLDASLFPDLFSDGSALKITSFRYFSPHGTTTDTVGVIPHLLVPINLSKQVAQLLSATPPSGDTAGYYRLDMAQQYWFIDQAMAQSETYRAAFEQLLSAIPINTALWRGTGGSSGWSATTPEDTAAECGVSYLDRSFLDTQNSPYAQQIDVLATYGILSGTGDGTYQPENLLTRAQLCMLLAQSLNCSVPAGDSAFNDVSMDTWYGPAVNALADMGLVSGVGNGLFSPDAPVTHEQYISIMARLAQHLNLYFYEAMDQIPQDALQDTALTAYSSWAQDDVWLLSSSQQGLLGNTLNLLWDDAGSIQPRATTSREEAAALLYQILSYTSILPV